MRPTAPRTTKLYIFSIGVIIVLAACSARKVSFITSTVVPTATGTVKVKKDKNNNYQIDVNTLHLADPRKLTPSKKTYVVWMQTGQNGVKNLGEFRSSTGMFSQTRRASLTTVQPFRPTKIFITAEDNGKIENPGAQVVMTTNSF